MSDDDLDMQEFLGVFFEECFENLADMETGLLDLNLGAPDVDAVNTIFRAAHSIKGGCAQFGFPRVSTFTHIMETLLDEMRAEQRQVSRDLVDILLESVDCLGAGLTASRDGAEMPEQRMSEMEQQLNDVLAMADGNAVPTSGPDQGQPQVAETEVGGWRIDFRPHAQLLRNGNDPLRIIRELAGFGEICVQADTSKLDGFAEMQPEDCLLAWKIELKSKVERCEIDEVFDWVTGDCELSIEPVPGSPSTAATQVTVEKCTSDTSTAQSVAQQPAPTVAAAPEATAPEAAKPAKPRVQTKESSSIRVSIEKLDALINLVGELVITQAMLSQFNEEFDMSKVDKLSDGLAQLERNTRELQESIMQVRMLPISFSFNRFPRLVRDLSNSLGKKIQLKLKGENTELDKTVLEKIGDPLVHLVRNSLDHGIEMPDVRLAAGKPEMGTITLNAYHEGGNIVIEVIDDGKGLPKQVILDKARERGLVGKDEILTDDQINNLIFQAGFSTAEVVTDVSGRGVGMDVVRRNINDLGGHVSITSEEGVGSTLTIRLPLTMAILDGQLTRVGKEIYVTPLVSIIETNLVSKKDVNSMVGKADLYHWRDEYLPIISLHNVFDIESINNNHGKILLVVVEANGRRVCLLVDELLAQQQVVIKSLETNFRQVKGLSGATILGDGRVALILDVPGLIQRHFHTDEDAGDSLADAA